MTYILLLLLLVAVCGVIGVAANPAPHFGVVGLVLGAGAMCGVLVGLGSSFIGLVLFLIYLGGMLVVFAYSVAVAADPYPEAWGSYSVLMSVVCYVLVVFVVGSMVMNGVGLSDGVIGSDWGLCCSDFSGVALMYNSGASFLLLCGWGLLLTLFVVLELVRGWERGSLCIVV